MNNDPNRRSFLEEVGAATVAGSVATPRTVVAASAAMASPPGSPYRPRPSSIEALADRTVSSRELVDDAIARIEALDPKINAVIVTDLPSARRRADAADAALARGESRRAARRADDGQGAIPTSRPADHLGRAGLQGWQPADDALAVDRLMAAGAVILGKTNVPLQLADWQSYNEVYGTTNNPWDVSRTPGGSSGGSAAALAAGFTGLELGSDIGGSMRNPAHYCGVANCAAVCVLPIPPKPVECSDTAPVQVRLEAGENLFASGEKKDSPGKEL